MVHREKWTPTAEVMPEMELIKTAARIRKLGGYHPLKIRVVEIPKDLKERSRLYAGQTQLVLKVPES